MQTETSGNLQPGELHQSELVEVVESVFGTMMSLETRLCVRPWFANRDRLTSVVHLAGDWNGAVLLECDRRQACRFAGRFLSIDIPNGRGLPNGDPSRTVVDVTVVDVTVDDVVRDVLGEVANIIGGNLKCVLSRGTRLSMPSVIDGDYSLRVCGARVRERLAFECAEGFFWVAVLTL